MSEYFNLNQQLTKKLEQLQVQLGGCLAAAEGWAGPAGDQIMPGDFGWSPAYDAVYKLRNDYDQLLRQTSEFRKYIMEHPEIGLEL